jgi:hypothetical protein
MYLVPRHTISSLSQLRLSCRVLSRNLYPYGWGQLHQVFISVIYTNIADKNITVASIPTDMTTTSKWYNISETEILPLLLKIVEQTIIYGMDSIQNLNVESIAEYSVMNPKVPYFRCIRYTASDGYIQGNHDCVYLYEEN